MKNNINSLRKAKGLSMSALAEKVGCTQQQIDRLEKGRRKLSAEWMEKLCNALDCRPLELVEFSLEQGISGSKVATATAIIIGAIETGFSNMIRGFDDEEKYEITFRPKRASDTESKEGKFFGLVVEGGSYGKHAENTELIFNEISIEDWKVGMAEKDDSFISNDKSKKHRFAIGNKIITAELVKSIRSE